MVSSFFLSIIVFIYLCFVNLILIIVASSDSESPTNLQDQFQEEYSRLIEEMSNKYPLNVIQSTEYKFPYNYEPKPSVYTGVIPTLNKFDSNAIDYSVNVLKDFKNNNLNSSNFHSMYTYAVDKLIHLLKTNDLNLINSQLNNFYSEFSLSLEHFSGTLPDNLRKEKFITSK